MGIALDGIGGFPTDRIVDELMVLEKRPGILLAEKKQDIDAGVRAFQNLNSQLSSLTNAAWGIYSKESKTDHTYDPMKVWGAVKGSSNNSGVSVEAKTGAKVGEIEFDVIRKAAAKRAVYRTDDLKTLSGTIQDNGGSFSILIGSKVTNIKPKSTSVDDIAAAINAVRESGVSATVVKLRDASGNEEKALQIVGNETGKQNGDFKIFGGDVAKYAGLSNDKVKHDAASQSTVYTFANHDKAVAAVGGNDGIAKKAVEGSKGFGLEAQDAEIIMYGRKYSYASNKLDLMDNVTVDISRVEQQKGSDGKDVTGSWSEVVKTPDNAPNKDGSTTTTSPTKPSETPTTTTTTSGSAGTAPSSGATPAPAPGGGSGTSTPGTSAPGTSSSTTTKENPTTLVAKGVKVTISSDPEVATKKVQATVSALNGILTTLTQGMKSVEKTRSGQDGKRETWKAPGVLSNSLGRQVQSQIGEILSDGLTIKDDKGNSQTYSLLDLGIEMKLTGTNKEMSVSFDSAKFKELMEKSPQTAQKLATALGDKIGSLGSRLSDATEGMITGVINTEKKESEYYDTRIKDFNDRLVEKEANMKKQYARLQTALAVYGQKQAWLQNQLAQLSGGMMGGK